MDEKEQADRMAAAEALFLISARVDKNRQITKTSKRGRKKKNDVNEVNDVIKKGEDLGFTHTVSRRGRGRRGGAQSQKGTNGKSTRGGKSNSSPRGRGAGNGRGRKTSAIPFNESDNDSHNFDNEADFNDSMSVSCFETISSTEEITKKRSKTKTSKLRDQRKSSQLSSSSSKSPLGAGLSREEEQTSHQAIGFTGATISIPEHPSRRGSAETSQNVSGSVSNVKQQQLNLNSKNFVSSLASLPQNLLSFPSDSIANLPSIPLELESLRLSSQPTPNLSSLGDQNSEVVMDYEENGEDREKSEKFLPLKKRKLHTSTPTSSMTFSVPTTTVKASSESDQEEKYEAMSPEEEDGGSEPPTPPTRSSFTVQAPPIITMQTLMEIKTALTPDEDGDL
uniref:Uncharacterized protein n=1 Tax=Biomphalaria glabrata TaxID=6526 RepID=A0A2C9L9V0_BIOGL